MFGPVIWKLGRACPPIICITAVCLTAPIGRSTSRCEHNWEYPKEPLAARSLGTWGLPTSLQISPPSRGLPLRLQVTYPNGHLSEMELCRFRNLTLNLTLTLCLILPIRLGQMTLRTSELSPSRRIWSLCWSNGTNVYYEDPTEKLGSSRLLRSLNVIGS